MTEIAVARSGFEYATDDEEVRAGVCSSVREHDADVRLQVVGRELA